MAHEMSKLSRGAANSALHAAPSPPTLPLNFYSSCCFPPWLICSVFARSQKKNQQATTLRIRDMSITALLSDFAVCAVAAIGGQQLLALPGGEVEGGAGGGCVAAAATASWQLAHKRKMQRKKLNAYFTNTNDKQGSCCCCFWCC